MAEHIDVRSRGSAIRQDSDGKEVRNLILRALPKSEYNEVFGTLELVRLKLHSVLHETGDTIRSGYFPNDGMGSVLTVQPDGETVEVALIGNEGFVGVPVVFGFKTSSLRIITQGDGTAYRIDVGVLRKLLPRCPALEKELLRFSMLLAAQTTQIAACNRLHAADERLARWLLMSHDRLGGKILPLTQEFLGQMLGTRRSTVSVAAAGLQKMGVISYTRGSVSILDRAKLKTAACECYEIIQRQGERWMGEVR